jgi:hypothetical protein
MTSRAARKAHFVPTQLPPRGENVKAFLPIGPFSAHATERSAGNDAINH